MAKFEKYTKDIEKAEKKLAKLRKAKEKEENKLLLQIAKNYVKLRRLENPEMSYDEILEYQKLELEDLETKLSNNDINEEVEKVEDGENEQNDYEEPVGFGSFE
ncbi:hypothetical protein CIRMBP1284_01807 [Enterococcus cecorum]|uniref:Uncharacterized protein n=2 Tax=Enterococcus cecorum TaxID=44008 RepID=A0A1Y4QXP8_9ENTE|nr:hypothetical protein [Enterococcus cecorum]OUQ10077.1 hypothetical protein B5E88_07725 [Enterococcus cecorum]CAI3255270.1 hypothetical protein CIRMBP1261_00053 [Enterococcus cecorum]CAI3291155.1 hypothetical protein CIRMBP1252_00568 [Enterococcus cecorum]CAI3304500.1 hypothetical protein CIRMBP1249_00567 [Enterococcus cecorum]CAI3307912.1 hypothetical protein CIRMBP1227_00629 [Enterococcus cecorum]